MRYVFVHNRLTNTCADIIHCDKILGKHKFVHKMIFTLCVNIVHCNSYMHAHVDRHAKLLSLAAAADQIGSTRLCC